MIKAPKNEILWVRCCDSDDNCRYVITSNIYREMYFLYEVKDNKLIKTKHKSSNPLDLYEFVEW